MCDAHIAGDPSGLRCVREDHDDRGHVFVASAGADLDRPHRHVDGGDQ